MVMFFYHYLSYKFRKECLFEETGYKAMKIHVNYFHLRLKTAFD